MFGYLKNTKAPWFLRVILLLVSIGTSMAQASEVFTLNYGEIPAALVNNETLIVPNPNGRSSDFMSINNFSMLTAKVTVAWGYETADVSPIYDMATYRISGGTAVNLPIAQGSRSQNGTATIEIGAYQTLLFEVASDGIDGGAQLGVTVQSIVYPPTLDVRQGEISLNTGVAVVDLQPVVLSRWDPETTPATTFAIQPALPAGLSMNSDGVITGTPTAAQPATNYTVTATRGGGTSTKVISIAVSNSVVASLTNGNISVRLGGPISPQQPVLGQSGTHALSYSVSPALPSGLTMATATGTVTGTPAALSASTSYTVTVTDGVTQAGKTFSLAVLPAADAPIATPNSVTWQAGVPSEVSFVVRSDIIVEETSYKLSLGGSLKTAGGRELWGTVGYPSYSTRDTTAVGNNIKFTWANPIPGTYAGEVYFYYYDTNYNPVDATIPFILTVTGEKANQTIAFTSTAPAAEAGGANYTPAAAATSGLTVNFSIENASAQVCQITAGQISYLQKGFCVINADQPGDGATNPAPQVQQVVEVAPGAIGTTAQTASFTSAAPSPALVGATYTPTATGSSGLSFQLVGDPASKSVCWPNGTEVIFFEAGSCTIHAEFPGNTQYAPAEATQTFSVVAAVTASQVIASKTVSAGSPIAPFTPVTGANGVGPLTYTVSPTLPEGFTWFMSTGEITGTPEAPSAEATYTVTVTDANGSTATATFKLAVTDGPAATLALASKGLTVNTAADAFTPVTGSGGTGALTYSVAPALPANLSMSASTGEITGTPTATSSTSNYTVTVTDENNRSGTATFTLEVNSSVVATQAIAAPHVTQGSPAIAFAPVTGSGGTPSLSYSISPDLPTGLSMNGSSGQVSGTPTAPSVATTFTVTVTDANGATATETFSLVVNGAISATQVVATKELTADTSAVPFTPVTGAGGRASLTYSVSPDLPAGLSLASTTGEITGTPTVATTATVYTITVTDANTATATATFSLAVNDAVVATQAISTKTLSANVAAVAFTPITGSGGSGTLVYSISPDLPPGLEINADTGTISGTATAGASETTYTVTITDEALAADTASFTLTVDGPLAATTAIASRELAVNTVVTSFTPVTGTGGTGYLNYSVSPALPSGLSMSSATGSITGTPTTPTTAATYTVTVADGNSTTATSDFSLAVATISSSVSLTSSTTSPIPGALVTLTASVTPDQATGFVTFKDSGNPIGAPVALAAGVAVFSTSALGNGSHSITADYGGSQTYAGSTSNAVTISLLSPAADFEDNLDHVVETVQNLSKADIDVQVQNSEDAIKEATGRFISSLQLHPSIQVSTKSAPVTFHSNVDATNSIAHASTDFFGQMSSGAVRRLVFGKINISKTNAEAISANLDARMAWEWSLSSKLMLGSWLGVDAGNSDVRTSFTGSQSRFGITGGIYGVGKISENLFASGFASVSHARNNLEMKNDTLDLKSDYGSNTNAIGASLTGVLRWSNFEMRPTLGVTYGRMNIGVIDFIGNAYGQTDDSLSANVGRVSVTTIKFSPEFTFHAVNDLTTLTLEPLVECQQIMASGASFDCGGGATIRLEHKSADGLESYNAQVKSENISVTTRTGVELSYRLKF